MNRFVKPLAFLLTLLMIIPLFSVPAEADSAISISVYDDSSPVTVTGTVENTLWERATEMTVSIDYPSSLFTPTTPTVYSFSDPAGKTSNTYSFSFIVDEKNMEESYSVSVKVTGITADGTPISGHSTYISKLGPDPEPEIYNPLQDQEETDKSKLQSKYDITLVPTPIAQDDKEGNVDLKLHLAYKGSKDFSNAPVSYFRIEPQVSGDTAVFPFEMEYSTYAKTMGDLVVELNDEKEVTATYFHFPLKVKKDAVNGYYPVTFKVYHLYQNTNLQETEPVETTITTYVEIRNGKKASGDSETPSADPSTAILLLEGYSVEPQEIRAGDEFDLTLRIRNTSDRTVTDVKSTLTEANKTIMPVSGASSFFIEKIKAGETYEHTIRLKATASAGVDPVELTLQNAFVQQDMGKTSSDTFILPVIQVSNLSMDPPSYPVEMYLGDSFNLMMSMYNKGKSRLYNVSVYLDSESMTADENYYAGNMESGSAKTYDVMVTPNMEGQISGDIVVTFEDAEGNVTEKRTPITLNVATMDWMMEDMYPVMPDDMTTDVYPSQTMMPLWVWFAIGAGVVAAGTITIVLIVRAKKRKNALVEDDDEMD